MVSAVILSYNRREEVLITIAELKAIENALPFDLEIIVVDNASVDDTSAAINSLHADVKLVKIEQNKGIAGWNDGFAVAKYEYLLVLDDDSHIVNGLAEAVTYLEAKSHVGILALNITTGPYQTKDWGWRDKQEIASFFGCGAIIRNLLFKQIGGFADWLIVYSHEWEYCLRANNAGYKTEYFEHSNVVHRASLVNRSVKRLRVFCARNEMAIVYKYFGKYRWLYLLRISINHLKYLRIGAFKHVYYSYLGIIEFLKMRRRLTVSPVSKEAQDFFAAENENTRPFFHNMIVRQKLKKTNARDK